MDYLPLIMFVVATAALMCGYPVAFTLGMVAVLFGVPTLGFEFFQLLPLRIWGIVTNFTLLAVPLFVFMGVVLQRAGLAEELLSTMAELCGRLRGGLALSVLLVGTLLGATTGVVGATVVTMGIIALPAMLKHGYATPLATGSIAAAGTLGQIVPPSIILILLGDVMGIPIGRLFIGAILPSAAMILMFAAYVAWTGWRHPERAPAMQTPFDRRLLWRVARSLLPPLLLIVAVLGSIFSGIASPTESAAIGSVGALLLAALHRQLSIANVREAAQQTARLTSMVFIILVGATAFGLVFRGLGGDRMVESLFTSLPGGEITFLAISMLLIFVLGFFLDFIEICFVLVPILTPIADLMGVNLLWFGLLIAVNLQTSFLTPPFGFSLFYLKAVAPAGVHITSIYRGIVPFVVIQLATLLLMIAFPKAVVWLPDFMDRLHGL